MMRRRGGLGRGLDALIPTNPDRDGRDQAADTLTADAVSASSLSSTGGDQAADGQAAIRDLPIDQIDPNPKQPRRAFDDESLEELAASIKAVGVLQPVVVRSSHGRFELVMGERRIRAAERAGLQSVPAIVRNTEDNHLLRDALLENIHREDLNPLEEAAAYEQLLGDFGVTHEELATRLGRSRSVISNAVRLLRLPPTVQMRIAAGTLSAGHARAVASLSNPEHQERLADKIVAEGLTVRMAEELARRIALDGMDPEQEGRPRRTRPVPVAPGMAALAERLSDRLETRVRVQRGKTKGRILIEFATLDDLQRICEAMGLEPQVARLGPVAPESAT
jgi:ParB family chromosome partitioning protein